MLKAGAFDRQSVIPELITAPEALRGGITMTAGGFGENNLVVGTQRIQSGKTKSL